MLRACTICIVGPAAYRYLSSKHYGIAPTRPAPNRLELTAYMVVIIVQIEQSSILLHSRRRSLRPSASSRLDSLNSCCAHGRAPWTISRSWSCSSTPRQLHRKGARTHRFAFCLRANSNWSGVAQDGADSTIAASMSSCPSTVVRQPVVYHRGRNSNAVASVRARPLPPTHSASECGCGRDGGGGEEACKSRTRGGVRGAARWRFQQKPKVNWQKRRRELQEKQRAAKAAGGAHPRRVAAAAAAAAVAAAAVAAAVVLAAAVTDRKLDR